MNRINSIFVAAGFALAMVFTFSCASNKSKAASVSSGCSAKADSASSCTESYNSATHYCSNGTVKEYGSVSHGEQKYKFVEIGEQVWMAENLNYNDPKSLCYENKPENCNKYGRLYDWSTAQKICPEGWHLPSEADWDKLMEFAGGKTAGCKLNAKTGWDKNSNGTDAYGFSALPGGEVTSASAQTKTSLLGAGASIGVGLLAAKAGSAKMANAAGKDLSSNVGALGKVSFTGASSHGSWWSSYSEKDTTAYRSIGEEGIALKKVNTYKDVMHSVRCLRDLGSNTAGVTESAPQQDSSETSVNDPTIQPESSEAVATEAN